MLNGCSTTEPHPGPGVSFLHSYLPLIWVMLCMTFKGEIKLPPFLSRSWKNNRWASLCYTWCFCSQHDIIFVQFSLVPFLIGKPGLNLVYSYPGLPQIWWLKTTELGSVTVLEPEGWLTWRDPQASFSDRQLRSHQCRLIPCLPLSFCGAGKPVLLGLSLPQLSPGLLLPACLWLLL
jgi:hypothetical protein